MQLTIKNTTRRGNELYIKRTQIHVASISYENMSTTIIIKNFDTDEIHWTNNRDKYDIQKYVIAEIRKDKRLYNKYKML